MANEEHLNILKQGVATWNQWREDYSNETLDLSGAKLRRANLSYADFSGTDLSYADLRRANLSYADLRRANLSYADFSGADLLQADLFDADLLQADLIGANLSRADFSRADFSRANLSYADFSGADLSHADLIGANLSRANLRRANLSYANLSYANLSLASIGHTVFGAVNLTDIKGLDSCEYYASSIVDHDTLTESGRLPLSFLRGVGLPDIFIDNIPALFLNNPIEFYSCFISYASADQAFAERLYADLQNKGVRCWFAPEDIKIGDPVRMTVDTAIRLRDKLVLVLSDTSIASDWVEHEVRQALEEEERRGTLVLFPLRIDDAVMQVEFGWVKRIREAHTPTGRHIGNFTQWKDHDAYQYAFDRLLRDLRVTDATDPS